MLDDGKKPLRVHKADRELFPAPKFGWDRAKYKEELDEQVKLKQLNKAVSLAKQKVLERALLAEDRRQANLNQSFRRGNIENLRKSFYSAVKVRIF